MVLKADHFSNPPKFPETVSAPFLMPGIKRGILGANTGENEWRPFYFAVKASETVLCLPKHVFEVSVGICTH